MILVLCEIDGTTRQQLPFSHPSLHHSAPSPEQEEITLSAKLCTHVDEGDKQAADIRTEQRWRFGTGGLRRADVSRRLATFVTGWKRAGNGARRRRGRAG